MSENPLKNIYFISVPESIEGDQELPLDPSRLIPVELTPGEEESQMANLTWEMILAAMLKVLAYQPDHQDAGYYRLFINQVKPDIRAELTSGGIVKAQEREFAIAEEIFLALKGLDAEDNITALNLALLYDDMADVYGTMSRDDLHEEYADKAHQAYLELLDKHGSMPEAHFNAGSFYLRNQSFDKARHHLSRYLEIGENEEMNAKAAEWLRELENSAERDSLFKEAYDAVQLGHEEEGIARIRDFLKENPKVWNAWFLLGWAHRRLEQYKEGKEAFLKALELGAAQVESSNELAICYMELEEYGEARRCLVSALEQEPRNTKIISNLGILSLKKGNPQEALGYFKTVLEYEPEDPIAAEYIKHLGDSSASE